MSPDWEGQRLLGPVPIGRDKAKSRWFSKSKSVCAGGSGKVPRLCAIWTPQCGGMKGKLCFIKRKSKILVSNDRIFQEKNVSFFERRERPNENLWTFLRNAPSFLFFLPIFWETTHAPSPPAVRRFLLRTSVRADGHAPAHRALSEFAIPAFTLHLHSQFIDTVCFAGEGLCVFFAFTGEGKRGEAFTRKSLMHSFLHPFGEEVKANNEKRRTRA